MDVVLLGGAPGIGKSAVARELLSAAARGSRLVQWVDVDSLWFHQPWQVTDRTKAMVEANLAAVLANAVRGGVDTVVVTWVFQGSHMHDLVRELAPEGVSFTTVQLVARAATWRARFGGDSTRAEIDAFYETRYAAAQQTEADHRIDTDGLDPVAIAEGLVHLLDI